jgi:hypothetical protein
MKDERGVEEQVEKRRRRQKQGWRTRHHRDILPGTGSLKAMSHGLPASVCHATLSMWVERSYQPTSHSDVGAWCMLFNTPTSECQESLRA